MNRRESFPIVLRHERMAKGWSQEELAGKLGCEPRTISRWEQDKGRPRPDMIQKLSKVFEKTPEDLGLLPEPEASASLAYYREEMEEAPSTENFCGRAEECEQLTDLITEKRCRLVMVLGMGGMGKTTLVARVVELASADFPRVFWRSLKNAPPLTEILKACLHFLSSQEEERLPTTMDGQLALLVRCLRAQRCLLVLDNLEAILQPGEEAGHYRSGYDDYALLFRRLGEVKHESCLLMTSRERPAELVALLDQSEGVRSFRLQSFSLKDGQELLSSHHLQGNEAEWQDLIERYGGNPLALKLAASSIHEMFHGQIALFLQERAIVLDTIGDLLLEHYQRLSVPERELLIWLAIERETLTRESLQEHIVRAPIWKPGTLFRALRWLHQRSLIELVDNQSYFLQPVILEYATDGLVKQAVKEFEDFCNWPLAGGPSLLSWQHFAFVQAQARDYIREAQTRLILAPVAEQLETLVGRAHLRECLDRLLEQERQKGLPDSYLASNVLHILLYLKLSLRGLDCSELMVRQAYLQDALLPEVRFAGATFHDVAFTSTFGAILSLALDPSGTILAAGTAMGEIWLYQIKGGVLLSTCKGHTDGVWSLAFSLDGRRLVSSSDDQTVRVWDVTTSSSLVVFGKHSSRVRAAAFSPDGTQVASGSDDRLIFVWDAASGEVQQTLRGHTDWVWSVVFHPEQPLLISGSADRTIRIWDLASGGDGSTCPVRILQGHTDRVRQVRLHPAGRLLASASEDRTVRLWDVEAGECLQVMPGHSNQVWSVAFNQDGTQLASGSEDYTIRLWETASAFCLRSMPQIHTQGVRAVLFDPAGLLISGSDDQTLRIYESHTGKRLRTLQGENNRFWCLAFSPHSPWLISGSEDQQIHFWDVQARSSVQRIDVPEQGIRLLAASPTMPLLASVGQGSLVQLWNMKTGKLVRRLTGHTHWVRALAFSPDGSLLASGGEDNALYLWSIPSGAQRTIARNLKTALRALAFSPDGAWLASEDEEHRILLRNVVSGAEGLVLYGHSQTIRALLFHPTRPWLLSGSEDRTIRIWDIESGKLLRVLSGHSNRVLGLDLDPTGTWLVSCSDDLSIRFWNLDNDDLPGVIEQAHESRVRAVIYSADGSQAVSCSDDGKIKIWDVTTRTYLYEVFSERPYERMNIEGVKGLNEAQLVSLKILGATE